MRDLPYELPELNPSCDFRVKNEDARVVVRLGLRTEVSWFESTNRTRGIARPLQGFGLRYRQIWRAAETWIFKLANMMISSYSLTFTPESLVNILDGGRRGR